MKERFDADHLLFDLDGTLVDSSLDIAHAANLTLSGLGYGTRPLEYIKERIGWGVKMLLVQLLPDEPPEKIEEARARFLEHYGGALTVHTAPYPGVMETMTRFRDLGKVMAVVTNKPEGLSVRLLEELGLDGFFRMVVGGDSVEQKKPHPEPILKVMEGLGADPARTVFVGDSPVDCESGRAAGVRTVGVSYGFRGVEELTGAGCDVIIDRFSDLENIVS